MCVSYWHYELAVTSKTIENLSLHLPLRDWADRGDAATGGPAVAVLARPDALFRRAL